MIIFLLAISICQLIFLTNGNLSHIRYNSLLSAQCKARCLYEYRNHSQYHRTFLSIPTKRDLSNHLLTLSWRSIWERCPRLLTCSSCLIPCDLDPPLLLSNKQTCQAICSTLKVIECEQSCLFIRNLYEQQSKCLINHCSNRIQLIEPTNVHAIERKSGRTVRLKWTSDIRLNTEPIFYVIEAQWTRPKMEMNQYELVSKWGFIKEEVSTNKAIIRNIQRDNRWYQYRVAAVTKDGYSIYSIPTKPFRLNYFACRLISANQSLIDSPKNFSIKTYELNSNTLNLTLTWLKSDSIRTDYQISWEFKDHPSSFVNTINTSALELTIPFLSIDQTYLFKIRSISRSNGHNIQMSSPESIDFNYQNELFSIKNFQISQSYFHNGLIKTNISWNPIVNSHFKQYNIYWIETYCSSDVFSCCYRRDAVTINNHFQLYDLRFNCTYLIQIRIHNLKKPFQFYFNVSSCQTIDIYGTIQPSCQTDRKTIDMFSSLPTFDLIAINNQSGLHLFWQNLPSYNEHMFYRLHIEQLPSHSNLITVDLPLTITNYFLSYSKKREIQQYLNVTLSLFDKNILRQEQSILIYDKQETSKFFNRSLRNFLSSSLIFLCIIRWIII